MMKGMLIKLFILPAAVFSVVSCAAPSAERRTEHVQQQGQEFAPVFEDGNDLRALMVDLIEANACPHLEGRFITLTLAGSSLTTSRDPAIGNLWIEGCSTSQRNEKQLMLSLTGSGWRRVEREHSRFGATFSVDEAVRFTFRISMTVVPDMAYSPRSHIVNVWLVPVQPLDVEITVIGETVVAAENIWSSIVGTTASMFGQSLEERFEQGIRQKVTQRFRSKLDDGMTLVVDLCTGQHDLRFGTFPKGQMPESAFADEGKRYLVNKAFLLGSESLLLSGPFEKNREIRVLLDVGSGRLKASWICEDLAQEIAQAYVDDKPLPPVEVISEMTVSEARRSELVAPASAECPVVLMLESQKDETEASGRYMIYHPGESQRPIVDCRE